MRTTLAAMKNIPMDGINNGLALAEDETGEPEDGNVDYTKWDRAEEDFQ